MGFLQNSKKDWRIFKCPPNAHFKPLEIKMANVFQTYSLLIRHYSILFLECHWKYFADSLLLFLCYHFPQTIPWSYSLNSIQWIQSSENSTAITKHALFLFPGDLYTTLSNGELYIRQISEKDISRSTFQCETRNRLTGEVSLSLTKGRLYLTRKYFKKYSDFLTYPRRFENGFTGNGL